MQTTEVGDIKKVAVVGTNKENVADMKVTLIENGFSIVKTKPDAVISLGGDGTFLFAERTFPSVPKLLIRDSNICKKCNVDLLTDVLHQLKSHEYDIEEHMKLSARVLRKNKVIASRDCANDFVLRNHYLPEAVRFSLRINGQIVEGELIGDGVVVSTPFGSTAYFYSITRRTFRKGIGIAFNNITKQRPPLVEKEKSIIRIKLLRKDADFASDNDPKIIRIKQGDEIEIRRGQKPVRIIRIRKRTRGLFHRIKHWNRRRSM